jgi:Type VI secretion system/phage-baseplate injector OB domain
MPQFFGKYRGVVASNVDPLHQGRLQVVVPSVLGNSHQSWAMPCVPYAGNKVGLYVLPSPGTNIWVEFEAGDPDAPIWSGCFWKQGEMPLPPSTPSTTKMLKTDAITLTLDDAPGAGGLTVEIKPPAVQVPLKLVMNSEGVAITCNPAALKLTPTGMEISMAPASIKLTSTTLELVMPPATVKLSAASLDLQHGSATVKLAGAIVTVNNGALEVI